MAGPCLPHPQVSEARDTTGCSSVTATTMKRKSPQKPLQQYSVAEVKTFAQPFGKGPYGLARDQTATGITALHPNNFPELSRNFAPFSFSRGVRDFGSHVPTGGNFVNISNDTSLPLSLSPSRPYLQGPDSRKLVGTYSSMLKTLGTPHFAALQLELRAVASALGLASTVNARKCQAEFCSAIFTSSGLHPDATDPAFLHNRQLQETSSSGVPKTLRTPHFAVLS
uniref:Uncharacterized protein n=1 Tax=Branchiostoma floridae TaxID=7739 RepID=C3ZCS8_BRAFL|eukprot:XP_002593661.1 hypothetical protein BRAFLDRAFT_131953 [Branchiostoma floridae]